MRALHTAGAACQTGLVRPRRARAPRDLRFSLTSSGLWAEVFERGVPWGSMWSSMCCPGLDFTPDHILGAARQMLRVCAKVCATTTY